MIKSSNYPPVMENTWFPPTSIVFSEAWKESEFGVVLFLAVTLERGAGIWRKLDGRGHV